jgi:U3 small nucleolar ribonucleoprotein protein IMP3
MRNLKFHEAKLLKRVNFLHWKKEHNERELQVMRRYHITERDDYSRYNRLAGQITKLTHVLRQLDASDPVRIELTDRLLTRLDQMGVLPTKKSLAQCEKLSTASFARRRLAVVMVHLRMAETVREAAALVEQGHVRVGPVTATDPATHVTKQQQDMVTWVDSSKIRRKVLAFNDAVDDFDLLNA